MKDQSTSGLVPARHGTREPHGNQAYPAAALDAHEVQAGDFAFDGVPRIDKAPNPIGQPVASSIGKAR